MVIVGHITIHMVAVVHVVITSPIGHEIVHVVTIAIHMTIGVAAGLLYNGGVVPTV